VAPAAGVLVAAVIWKAVAVPGVTVSGCVPEVIEVGEVLAAVIVGFPDFVSE
jgi:hypothetical protein